MSTKLTKSELKYWLAFSQVTSIGPVRWQRLLDYFADLNQAWKAPTNELIKAGLEPKIVQELTEKRLEINPDFELKRVEKLKVKIITILDPDYPKLLKEIYAPPPLLYYLGKLDLNNEFPIAAVGTRKISEYGRQVTEQLAGDLASAGITIISGLALGIDACAQQTAIEAGGRTISVLGSGINQIYPSANRQLAQKIIATGGAIITEFPLNMPPLKHNFPQRNRIISGLSLGTLVTEAGVKSGALITAKYTLEQNREVFAVPGNIYHPGCFGPNQLIKLGAKTVTKAEDILEVLNLEQAQNFKAAKKMVPENETEKILLELLSDQPAHIDKLSQSARLNISVINSTLAVMEMKGLIKHLGNQKYIKSR